MTTTSSTTHHSLGGRTPAEVAGVADQVPREDSWEDITRMGGKVAEVKQEVVETKGKKSPPRTPPQSVVEAAAAFLEQKKHVEDKAKHRKRNPAIGASYPPGPKPQKRGGGSQKGMKI